MDTGTLTPYTAPQLDINAAFAALTAGLTLYEVKSQPKRNRITVVIDLPHLKKYGHDPTRELVYGCNFPVALGDLVSCPPTPLGKQKWTTAMVVALDGGRYKGPVKYVRKITPDPQRKK